MTELMNEFEVECYNSGYNLVVGLDEVGRGAMAGPVVAAAVILDRNIAIEGLNDSKKLTKKKREKLFDEIFEKSISVTYEFIDVKTVDKINVYQASKKAMLTCLSKLDKYDFALTDAMPLEGIMHKSIIKGDSKSISIAAASIVAKVLRDRYMDELSFKYPEYGFDKHVGYCTKKHIEMVKTFGIIDGVHRITFSPIKDIMSNFEQLSLFD